MVPDRAHTFLTPGQRAGIDGLKAPLLPKLHSHLNEEEKEVGVDICLLNPQIEFLWQRMSSLNTWPAI